MLNLPPEFILLDATENGMHLYFSNARHESTLFHDTSTLTKVFAGEQITVVVRVKAQVT